MEYSISPSGEKFKLPNEEEFKEEFVKLKELANEQRKDGKEIVVVMGLGFVGAVMAGVVADSVPELEYEETLNKARALLRAIELAQSGFVA